MSMMVMVMVMVLHDADDEPRLRSGTHSVGMTSPNLAIVDKLAQ